MQKAVKIKSFCEQQYFFKNLATLQDEERVFVMNTLFNLAETHLLASLVHFMDRFGA